MSVINMLLKGTVIVAIFSLLTKAFSRRSSEDTDFLQAIMPRLEVEMKSAKLALQKSSPKVGELAQVIIKNNNDFYNKFLKISQRRRLIVPSADESNATKNFYLQWHEEKPFDVIYLAHQLDSHQEIIALLNTVIHSRDITIRDIAQQALPVFTASLRHLRQLIAKYITFDEDRVREFAHQIWLEEGKPEGEEERHWRMACKLSNSLSIAELQLSLQHEEAEWSTIEKH